MRKQPFFSVKKCKIKKYIFDYDVMTTPQTPMKLNTRQCSFVPTFVFVRLAVSEELKRTNEHTDRTLFYTIEYRLTGVARRAPSETPGLMTSVRSAKQASPIVLLCEQERKKLCFLYTSIILVHIFATILIS